MVENSVDLGTADHEFTLSAGYNAVSVESTGLLLIGDSSVGKTCIMCRYAEDRFHTSFTTTIGKPARVIHAYNYIRVYNINYSCRAAVQAGPAPWPAHGS